MYRRFIFLAIFNFLSYINSVEAAKTPETVTVSKIPFDLKMEMKAGDATIFSLPNSKTVAVWCVKSPGIAEQRTESGLKTLWSEKPFVRLEMEMIRNPDGGMTSGEWKSYIRQGPVISCDYTSEYVLFIENMKFSIIENLTADKSLPVEIKVVYASEEEQVAPKQFVDYLLKKLKDKDPKVQIETMNKLQEELILGDTYAKPRWLEIIEAIRPLTESHDSEVKAMAKEKLIILGDEKSILEVITPEPKGKWLTKNEANSLATYSKHFGKEKIYRHVLTFFDSGKPALIKFALEFFSNVNYPQVRLQMEKALNSNDPKVRLTAFNYFTNKEILKRNEVIALIEKMLSDPDKTVVTEALREAGRYLNEVSTGIICKHLKNQDSEIRCMAAYALDCCKDPIAIAFLMEASKDANPEVRGQAATSLGRSKNKMVYERLIEMLKDKNAEVRKDTVNGLRWLDDKRAVPEIKRIQKEDPDSAVRKMAKRTLQELGEE